VHGAGGRGDGVLPCFDGPANTPATSPAVPRSPAAPIATFASLACAPATVGGGVILGGFANSLSGPPGPAAAAVASRARGGM